MPREIPREVEEAIGRLALQHGRVHVSGGFTDGLVRATTPNGVEHFINEDGVIVRTGMNFSVDWTRSA
jgi:hypothetical protein